MMVLVWVRAAACSLRRPRVFGWLVGLCVVAVVGVAAGPAGAGAFSQQTLPFSGLRFPFGLAVDGAGDVFVADTLNNRVVELPAGGAQQTLPFSGLSAPI